MNKVILILIMAIFLAACSTDEEASSGGTGGNNGGGSGYIPTPANVFTPEIYREINPVLQKNEALTIGFSVNGSRNGENYVFEGTANSPIYKVEFSYDFGSLYEIEDYIDDSLSARFENLNQTFRDISSTAIVSGSISLEIDDLPADLYQDIRYMDLTRLISNGLKIRADIHSGRPNGDPDERIVRSLTINIDIENENEVVLIRDDFVNNYSFAESSNNYIEIPLVDPDTNDNLTYSIQGLNSLEYINLSTEHLCEENLTNCVVPKGSNRVVRLAVQTPEITEESVSDSFTVIISDQSASGERFENKNTIQANISVVVNNTEEDLTPTLSIPNCESSSVGCLREISELQGGTLSYTVNPAVDRPDAELTVSSSADLAEINMDFNHDVENNMFTFENINISENVEFILIITVSDGEYSSSREVLIRLIEDVDRSPEITVPATTQDILESAGGFVEYSASSRNPNFENVTVTGEIDLNDKSITVTHNTQENRFEFSDIRISDDFTTTLRIAVSDGLETSTQDVIINFRSDINISLQVNGCSITSPQSVLVCENTKTILESGDEAVNRFMFDASIENNSQERELTFSHQINLPDGVVLTRDNPSDASSGFFFFDVENFSIRNDVERVLTIEVSDGVSNVLIKLPILFQNDIDKELSVFKNNYNPLRDDYVSMLDDDAERVLLEFYSEYAQLNGFDAFELNRLSNQALNSINNERSIMANLVNQIDTFVSEQEAADGEGDPAIYEDAYLLVDALNIEMRNHGKYAVDRINRIIQPLGAPTLNNNEDNVRAVNGVYGRYVGNSSYGRFIVSDGSGTNRYWEFNDGFKALELVSQNRKCN